MFQIMGEIAGPMRNAMMDAPDRPMDGRVDAHSDLALLRRALQSAGLPFVEDRGLVYVPDASGEETVFNAFDTQTDADALFQSLHMSCTQFLWFRWLTTPGGRRSATFRANARAWRRAVVTFAAALPALRV